MTEHLDRNYPPTKFRIKLPGVMDRRMFTHMVCCNESIYHTGRELLSIIRQGTFRTPVGIMAKVNAFIYSICPTDIELNRTE